MSLCLCLCRCLFLCFCLRLCWCVCLCPTSVSVPKSVVVRVSASVPASVSGSMTVLVSVSPCMFAFLDYNGGLECKGGSKESVAIPFREPSNKKLATPPMSVGDTHHYSCPLSINLPGPHKLCQRPLVTHAFTGSQTKKNTHTSPRGSPCGADATAPLIWGTRDSADAG